MGIEPTLPAWEAGVLPLNYTRMIEHYFCAYGAESSVTIWSGKRDSEAESDGFSKSPKGEPLGENASFALMERKTGFEPATLALARRCSTPEPLPQIILIQFLLINSGASDRSRTCDLLITSQLLYLLSYAGNKTSN